MQRFGMTVPLPGVPLHAHEDWLRELVDLGYTDLWTQETGGFDAFTPLALAAVWAPSARLGTAIAQIPTRGPATLASQAAALADAAPGRFVLGIGSSSEPIARDWNDLPFERPYARTRDTLQFLRGALAGERIDARYETFAVRGFRLERAPDVPPPIYVAALRERMLRLAGREADGVLLSLVTPEDVEQVLPLVREGGRARDVVLRMAVCPIEDVEHARAIGRRMLATYLNVPSYARFHDWLGRGELLVALREARAAGDREAAARAIPNALVDALFIHGSPEACREQIERFVAAGVTTPIVGLFLPDGDLRATLRALAPA
jgi:probable F420-dependent oxidoreductase